MFVAQVTAPSRLHFGLLSFGNPTGRQHGGVGVMVDQPGLTVSAIPSERFSVEGSMADRVAEFARRWHEFYQITDSIRCRIRVEDAPLQHVGLGVGTQLALSVATLLHLLGERPLPPPHDLASSVGRAARSSIGSLGFARGGLLFELGKLPSETLASLEDRAELPGQWRVVLICPTRCTGLSGRAEVRAFDKLPPVSPSVTERLIDEVKSKMLPAAMSGHLTEFSESVYRYGVQAGKCFATQQGGPFANERLESWVRAIRRRGIPGVGQSSWGPTLFVFQRNHELASEFAEWFRRDHVGSNADVRIAITRINNCGATTRVNPAP